MNRSISLALRVSLLSVAACGTTKLRNEQLESVAKDWSYVIRASQVMPVYPMTEDLFPGDVFLVQLPINEQHKAWNQKGFLPLDNHMGRIAPVGYEPFYDHSFELLQSTNPPKPWLVPPSTPTPPAPATTPLAWSFAPRAAFPSYSFEAKKGYGFSGALPIQGVPVGLSLLGAENAYGTVTLADARTYGTEIASLYPQLQDWARKHRDLLTGFAPHKGHVNYLRVVNRVYLVGRVAVSIDNQKSFSGGGKVGAAPPVELLIPERPAASSNGSTTAPPSNTGGQPAAAAPGAPASGGAAAASDVSATAAYVKNLEALNKSLEATYGTAGGVLPGLTFKVTAASARSVSMTETFPRPLVIGYLGFDVAIGENGDIGSPVPTYSVVEYEASPALAKSPDAQLTTNARTLTAARSLRQMASEGNEQAVTLLGQLNALGALVPALSPVSFYGSDGNVTEPRGTALQSDPPRYEDVAHYIGALHSSIANLDSGKTTAGFKLGDQPPDTPTEKFIDSQLAKLRFELTTLLHRLESHAELLSEVDRMTAPYKAR